TNATWISGTSFSSPFAGSVAALIWAADPALSATQVWNIMVDTAHSSPDSDVNRYVNAYDAVLRAVDSALTVEITAPSDGGSESMGRSIALRADVGYVVESGAQPIHVEWWSSINGILSTDTLSTVNGVNGLESGIFADSLAPGIHTLRFRASAGGTMVEDSITLTVTNTPPTATITQPSSGSEACVGTTVNLRGTGIDIDDLSGLSESSSLRSEMKKFAACTMRTSEGPIQTVYLRTFMFRPLDLCRRFSRKSLRSKSTKKKRMSSARLPQDSKRIGSRHWRTDCRFGTVQKSLDDWTRRKR
ncbi:MAG: S8 family serine peptidase, partial [Verrucomicrobiota bacterium]